MRNGMLRRQPRRSSCSRNPCAGTEAESSDSNAEKKEQWRRVIEKSVCMRRHDALEDIPMSAKSGAGSGCFHLGVRSPLDL